MCVPWLMRVRDVTQHVKTERTASRLRHCVAWLIHVWHDCAMTHLYSCYDTGRKDRENSFSFTTLHDMTPSCVCHDVFLYVCHEAGREDRENSFSFKTLPDTAWHDSFVCVPWPIFICVIMQDVKTERTASRLRHCLTSLKTALQHDSG